MKISVIKNSPRAADLLTKDVTVDFGNDQLLNLKVRVTGVSEKTSKALLRLGRGIELPELDDDASDDERAEAEKAAQDVLDGLVDTISRVLGEIVVSWDGTDDDGNPLLPTKKVFAAQDPMVLFPLMEAVGEVLTSDPKGNSKSSKRSKSAKK